MEIYKIKLNSHIWLTAKESFQLSGDYSAISHQFFNDSFDKICDSDSNLWYTVLTWRGIE